MRDFFPKRYQWTLPTNLAAWIYWLPLFSSSVLAATGCSLTWPFLAATCCSFILFHISPSFFDTVTLSGFVKKLQTQLPWQSKWQAAFFCHSENQLIGNVQFNSFSKRSWSRLVELRSWVRISTSLRLADFFRLPFCPSVMYLESHCSASSMGRPSTSSDSCVIVARCINVCWQLLSWSREGKCHMTANVIIK